MISRPRRIARLAAAPLVAALTLTGCAQGGLDLGDSPGALVSEQEVTKMSLQTWQRIKQEERPSRNRAMQQRVDRIVATTGGDITVFGSGSSGLPMKLTAPVLISSMLKMSNGAGICRKWP